MFLLKNILFAIDDLKSGLYIISLSSLQVVDRVVLLKVELMWTPGRNLRDWKTFDSFCEFFVK